jgi:hypothetical protein
MRGGGGFGFAAAVMSQFGNALTMITLRRKSLRRHVALFAASIPAIAAAEGRLPMAWLDFQRRGKILGE